MKSFKCAGIDIVALTSKSPASVPPPELLKFGQRMWCNPFWGLTHKALSKKWVKLQTGGHQQRFKDNFRTRRLEMQEFSNSSEKDEGEKEEGRGVLQSTHVHE